MVFKGRAKKPLHYYNFRNNSSLEAFVDKMKQGADKREEMALADKKAIAEFELNINVGDVYVSSWGYDQTNVDFYKVTAVKGKKITFQQIGFYSEENSEYYMSDRVLPNLDKNIGEEFNKIAKVCSCYGKAYLSLRLNSYSSLSKWDGKSEHRSWGH